MAAPLDVWIRVRWAERYTHLSIWGLADASVLIAAFLHDPDWDRVDVIHTFAYPTNRAQAVTVMLYEVAEGAHHIYEVAVTVQMEMANALRRPWNEYRIRLRWGPATAVVGHEDIAGLTG